MARVKGRDVVIDMMDAVEKLHATSAEHAELLESMAAHAMQTSAELTALSVQMVSTSKRLNEVSHRVTSLEGDFHSFAENFVRSATLARTTEEQLGRLARLLGEFAGDSNSRFDSLEGRVSKLG